MVGHWGSSAGSYLADPTSPIPSHCASIVVSSTLRVKWKPGTANIVINHSQAFSVHYALMVLVFRFQQLPHCISSLT